MIVLVTGAQGFLGSRLVCALLGAGHHVVCAVRRPPTPPTAGAPAPLRYVRADFSRDHDPETWAARLAGVDVVVNAAGILRESADARFEDVHVRGPCALFAACAMAGVPRVVQVSALGADERARSAYHVSKKAADDYLLRLPLASVAVVQPSLVYGPGGTSARLFTRLASLPLIPLPGDGDQALQPIHADDAVRALLRLVEDETVRGRVPLVGPREVTLRESLAALREGMGLGRARFLPVPRPLVTAGARLMGRLPASLLDADTWQMLERGNTAPADATVALLGHPPRAVEHFVGASQARAVRREAQLGWLLPLLRLSITLVWIVTGIVSLGIYPVAQSLDLLARAGVPETLRPAMLYGAAALDLALGVATMTVRRHRRVLWRAQIGLILFYTLIITVRLPEFWLHPYGPVLKNLPLLAALVLLDTLEEEEGRR